MILVPSLGEIFKALFLASAVVVIAGVTYIAADKAIAGIREAIRKKKNPPAHYKVVRRTNGLLIGDGMSKNEAVSRARAREQHKADQALLVAWGGLTRPASREFRTDSAFRVWDGDALLRELFHVYEELPAETKAKIPLKQTWILDEDALL